MTSPAQNELFDRQAALPEGFIYQKNFITPSEEALLLEEIAHLAFEEASYRQWIAKRRIVSYGGRYDFTHNQLNSAEPVPPFLYGLREKIAAWSRIAVSEFNHATVAEYRPGTQLGWHRDVPNFEAVAGISLAGSARMRFRPYPPDKRYARATATLDLQPRSAYVMNDAARWQWQHAISPTKELRYSITFRTLRR